MIAHLMFDSAIGTTAAAECLNGLLNNQNRLPRHWWRRLVNLRPLPMFGELSCSPKKLLATIVDQAHNQKIRGHSCADPRLSRRLGCR